ncbi:SDR family oxidoreductase [Hymenobacter volaticus]|uniref:SDR family oxidoreductase n=1 Tax=Hymenobacter volaticus TaxID=2932254 RepID=A0ABY4GF51_9BACT|nr:SDR family oxidoreductase [Hymenobacter volaticus]UOQ69446.1 SDR family oxidoreductase [Hymenobacter volaticus]
MENLQNQVVVITGASSGMGAATARKLVQLGAKVVLAARREDQLQALVAELGEHAHYVRTDVSQRADMDNLIQQAIARFGRVDVLWNNAGVMPVSFFDEYQVEEWERMIDINLKGVLYGIQAVLPHMLERGTGHILATSSTAGFKTHAGTGVYSATKFAVRAVMETLREELAGQIKVSTIYPGSVMTELGHDITSPKIGAMVSQMPPMQRLTADDIANAVVYLLSQPAHVAVNDLLIRPLDQPM